MKITRTFTHRAYGPIATATLAHGNAGWTLDGKPLPQASVEYLLGFALQSLQDAYAGAKSPEAAKTAYAAKRNRLIEGTVGARREALPPHFRYVRQLVRNALSAENKARYDAAQPKDRNKFLADLFNRLDETKRERIEATARTMFEASTAKVSMTI